MLTLAAAKDSGDAFPAHYCASTVHHPQSPQVVEFPVATARWAEEGQAQGRHCDASWGENLSQMSQKFLEKTVECVFFFFFGRGLSSLAKLCFILSHTELSLELQEAFSHLLNVSCPYSMYGAWTSHSTISPSCLGISKCSDYCGKEDQGKAPLGSLCAAQDESQLDGNMS